MTDLEKLKIANMLMAQTKYSVDEFLIRVATDKTFKYKRTNHYKSYIALEQSAKSKPPPSPKPPPAPAMDLERGKNVLFLTDDISGALSSDPKYKLAATADWGYREKYTSPFLTAAIKSGRFRIWCDCRLSDEGTPPSVARMWAMQLGLPWPECFIGQGENTNEFDAAVNAGAGTIVGNINPRTPENPGGLTAEQWALIETGKVIFINETYWNVQPNMPPVTWHNLDGVAGNCVAVYESSSEPARYYSLVDQMKAGKFVKGRDSVYVAGMRPEDWAALQ